LNLQEEFCLDKFLVLFGKFVVLFAFLLYLLNYNAFPKYFPYYYFEVLDFIYLSSFYVNEETKPEAGEPWGNIPPLSFAVSYAVG
jgi:hypothetical protein